MNLRPYQPNDLPRMLTFLGECLRDSNFCNFHPGDISHWMSSEKRGKDLEKYYWLYEEDNKILAFAELLPVKSPGYTLIVHQGHRGGDLERALLQYCETEMWQRVQAEGSKETAITVNVAECDTKRVQCLTALGYQLSKRDSEMRRRSLAEPIASVVLPEGFTIRSVAGEHEAALIAEVHSSSFNSSWTAESYLEVLRSPSFKIENELVVVAPDGRFAAFLVYWLDPISKSGLFEPVGCHKDFRQRGLTKALMTEGMKRMIDAGMETALVGNKVGNKAASRLYESLGLKTFCEGLEYSKTMR
ncbi:MAG: GNAT family N-acetyltransferase [Trueperaceae bacterium]